MTLLGTSCAGSLLRNRPIITGLYLVIETGKYMDKTFAFALIAMFAVCASFATWAFVMTPKRNVLCRAISVAYVSVMWMLIVAAFVVTLLY